MINFRRSRAPQVSELCRYRAMQFAGLRQLLIITGRTSRKPCFWNFRKKLQIFNKNVKSCKYNGIRFPDDVYVKSLERCHAPIVCEHWPWKTWSAAGPTLPRQHWSNIGQRLACCLGIQLYGVGPDHGEPSGQRNRSTTIRRSIFKTK